MVRAIFADALFNAACAAQYFDAERAALRRTRGGFTKLSFTRLVSAQDAA
jgi:hypothetical protein